MENQINDIATEKTPDQIEAEMKETRESLTEQVAELEQKVFGTVKNATETISEAVDAVKTFVTTAPETVSETVEQAATAVREKVAKTFDISEQVRTNPWQSVGVSLGVGFLTGFLLTRDERPRERVSRSESAPAPRGLTPTPPPESSRGFGLIDSLVGTFGQKFKEMTESAIDSVSTSINQNIRDVVPRLMKGQRKN